MQEKNRLTLQPAEAWAIYAVFLILEPATDWQEAFLKQMIGALDKYLLDTHTEFPEVDREGLKLTFGPMASIQEKLKSLRPGDAGTDIT